MPLLLPFTTLDVSEGAGSSMRLMPRTRSNFLTTESVGDLPDSADFTTLTVSAIRLASSDWFHPFDWRAVEILLAKSSTNSFSCFVMMSFFRFDLNGLLERLDAMFMPGATSLGNRPSFSTHLRQAWTLALPIKTDLVPTFIAPQTSHSPIVSPVSPVL